MRGRSALVVGATGLVGHAVVAEILSEDKYEFVHVLVRKPLPPAPRLVCHVVDFSQLGTITLPPIDDLFCCLGTTIKTAGSQQAFRQVDFDFVVESARLARRSGAQHAALVSAAGASSDSRMFYSRVKGDAEKAIAAIGFERVLVVRPSLLTGDRQVLGQPARWAEKLSQNILIPFAALIPARVRPISGDSVARAMVDGIRLGAVPFEIWQSDRLQRYAQAHS